MSFLTSLAFVLAHEGGRSNHKNDRGKLTNFGITQRTWEEYTNDPHRSVANITPEQAGEVYKIRYWHAAHCDELPDDLALVVFDSAVNCGVSRAVKWLQAAIGTKADGVFGNKSRTALAQRLEKFSEDLICDDIISLRRLHYARLIAADPTQKSFQRGWERRVSDLEKEIGR